MGALEGCVSPRGHEAFHHLQMAYLKGGGIVIGRLSSKKPHPSLALKNNRGLPLPVYVYAAPYPVVPLWLVAPPQSMVTSSRTAYGPQSPFTSMDWINTSLR